MTTSYIDTILNLLYAGEKVRISFPTPSLRESFRKKLYAKKKEQDDALKALLDEPKQTLRCSWNEPGQVEDITVWEFTCWLEAKKITDFHFKLVTNKEEQNENENILREDETLSANLASTPKQSKENS